MSQSERDLQTTIVTWLRLSYPQALVFEFGRPGGHKALAGALPVGWLDLLVVMPRANTSPVYFHFEIKAERGKVSLAQADMFCRLSDAGAQVHIVWSLDDVRRELAVMHGFEPQGGL